jgi:hypothetical protein
MGLETRSLFFWGESMSTVKITLSGNRLRDSDKVLLGSGLATRVAETRLIKNGAETEVTFVPRRPLTLGRCENIGRIFGETLLDLTPV